MNVENRYTIVLYGLNAKDFENIDKLIVQAIREVFEKENIRPEVIDAYLQQAGNTTFTKTKDKSMVARLNKSCDNTWLFADLLQKGQLIATDASWRISRLLLGGINQDYRYPYEELFASLEDFYGKPIFSGRAAEIQVTLILENHEIWGRFVIPLNRTFDELHEVLQIAFQWNDSHLHEYYILGHTKPEQMEYNWNDPGSTVEGYGPIVNLVSHKEAFDYPRDMEMQMETGIKLSDHIPASKAMIYHYDFGDSWRHRIDVEKVINEYEGNHPVCLDWQGDAPP